MMPMLEQVLGQEAAVSALRRAIDNDRVANAYLFHGPTGVGKQRCALAVAQRLVAAGDATAARRIDEGKHPDVRVFVPREDGKRNIQVDTLRDEILPLTQFAPFETDTTFFIFPDADISFPTFQPEAANALLKTLEEPRPGVHFILTASRPTALLSTIRSRCQPVRFRPLSVNTLELILQQHGADEDAIAPCIALSGGRADVALALAQDNLANEVIDLVFETDAIVRGNRPGAMIDHAERLTGHPQFELTLSTLQTLYRDVVTASLGLPDETLWFRHRSDEVKKRAQGLRPSAAAARVARIQDALEAMRKNANVRLATDALLFDLKRLQ